jgi:GH25 family lysozyme M1 (1,4-beta-N-acetylmuramidase)
MQGIDVSAFQGQVDWQAIWQSGIEFAFVRATDGYGINAFGLQGSVDAQLTANIQGTEGHSRGFYHVLDAGSIAAQFQLFQSVVPKDGIWALDIEPGMASTLGSNAVVQAVQQWRALCAAQGKQPLIYTAGDTLSLIESTGIGPSNIWLAAPGSGQPQAACWQYGQGSVNGIQGVVDFDEWLLSPWEWLTYAGQITSDYPIVGMATRAQGGYWIAAQDGGVFAYGGAPFYGSVYSLGLTGLSGARPLAAPVCGIAATPSGNGYWGVAEDGGLFPFGDAPFFGNTYTLGLTGLGGSRPLAKPVCGIAPTPTGQGYYLIAQDGGLFPFGDATYFGHPVYGG